MADSKPTLTPNPRRETRRISPPKSPPLPSMKSPKIKHYLATEHVISNSNRMHDSAHSWLLFKFPIIHTLQHYDFKRDLFADIAAGVTIGVQLLPKGMAYAMMAKLDKSAGVTVAMMCSFLYPLCGSTPYLSAGPDPIICLLIQRSMEQFGYSQSAFDEIKRDCGTHCEHNLFQKWKAEKNTVMGMLLLIVVAAQIVGNLFHAGFISNFLTKPIVDAFVCSAALIIMLKQLHYCLNFHMIESDGTFYENFRQMFHAKNFDFSTSHLIVAILTFVTLFILFGLHFWAHAKHLRYHKAAGHIPSILLVVLLGIGFTYTAEGYGKGHWFADHDGVALVGSVNLEYSFFFNWPKFRRSEHEQHGGYHLALNYLPEGHHLELSELVFKSLQIAFVSYFCSIIVCRKLAVKASASKRSFSVDPNQEMLGLGIANFGCLLLGGFPCGGILAMSVAVTNSSARTCFWSFFCGLTIFALAHTPICIALLAKLPKAVLAAIVIETVIPLIDVSAVWGIGAVLKLDLLQYAMTMIFCLVYDINTGIMVGMLVAVLILVYRGTRHRVGELGRIPNSVKFKIVDQHKDALIADQILVCRVYDSLCFTNWYSCEQVIESMMAGHQKQLNNKLIAVIIDFVKCGNVDSTAAFGLFDFCTKNASKGIAIRCSQCSKSVLTKLTSVGLPTIYNCGVAFKFYESDHEGVIDIIHHHKALHRSGSVHMSEAALSEKEEGESTNSV